MMLYVYVHNDDGHRRMPVDELAELLRPLLAQPAPADVADVPQPDWDTAPTWAQWWAVDECGAAWWYAQKPVCRGVSWRSNFGDYKEDVGDKTHPAWRDSLAYRPQPAPAPDVAALTADRDTWRTACELAAGDVTRITADRDAWREIARGMSPVRDGQLLSSADMWQGFAEEAKRDADQLRRQLNEANATAGSLASDCEAIRREREQFRNEWIAASTRADAALNERDTALNERDAARRDYKLADTALDAAKQHAKLALADARQEIAALRAANAAMHRQMADMEQERAELLADRDEWRETAQSSAHKVAVAREALGAE